MKKRICFMIQEFCAIVLCAFVLSGCALFNSSEGQIKNVYEKDEHEINTVLDDLNKNAFIEEDTSYVGDYIPHNEIEKSLEEVAPKKYAMVLEEGEIDGALLTINEENGTFQFSYDVLSSYLPYGTYEINGTVLTATTKDGKYKYRFQIIDEDTLKFIEKGSADVSLIDDGFGVQIEDGTEFKWDVLVRPSGKKVWYRTFAMEETNNYYQFPNDLYEEDILLKEYATSLNIPEEDLLEMSTEQLADACLGYPRFGLVYASSSTMENGLQWVIDSFNGFEELFKREDAGTVLLQIYRELNHEEIVASE